MNPFLGPIGQSVPYVRTQDIQRRRIQLKAQQAVCARKYRQRLVTTHYYTSIEDGADGWARVSRACTKVTAVRAALGRIIEGQFAKAVVTDEDGVTIATLTAHSFGVVTIKID